MKASEEMGGHINYIGGLYAHTMGLMKSHEIVTLILAMKCFVETDG